MKRVSRGNGKFNHRTHNYTNINIEKGLCSDEKTMRSRINNQIIIIKCPKMCEFFEECIAKSGEGEKYG